MHVDRGFGPIGIWYFYRESPVIVDRSREDYSHLLQFVQTVAEVLEEYELLSVERVIFEDPRRPTTTLDLPKGVTASALASTIEANIPAAYLAPSFVLPEVTMLAGHGVVFDANGKRVQEPDVTWLYGTALGRLGAVISTQVDAWMEYTLDARHQPEVWNRNAPRLEQALREIEKKTGITVDPAPNTRFANQDRYRLLNQVYADGEIVDCSILLEDTGSEE
jgi:hypothetical protein